MGDTLPGRDPGSLKIVVSFYGYNQQGSFQHTFTMHLQTSPGPRSRGHSPRLWLRLRLEREFPGGLVLDVKVPTTSYAQSACTNIGMPNPNGWTTHQINISMRTMSNAGCDPTSDDRDLSRRYDRILPDANVTGVPSRASVAAAPTMA